MNPWRFGFRGSPKGMPTGGPHLLRRGDKRRALAASRSLALSGKVNCAMRSKVQLQLLP